MLQPDAPRSNDALSPRIVVIGVGGAGGNAVDNMIRARLEGVDFVVANTDAQALEQSQCGRQIQLGHGVTRGLGAGARPELGRAAAEEALEAVLSELKGAQMAFITAGMGGGTGTGGAPVIAQAARAAGILTVAVVTKPFHFEGTRRMRLAEAGIAELREQVDTLIVIPNQNLFRVTDQKTTFGDAFKLADDVLYAGVRGVTDLVVMPGLVNLDFADIRAVMAEMGQAIMGLGEAEGDGRALAAAEAAISNPLLDAVSMKGARGALINITGGPDLTLYEVDQAANRIRDEVDPEANIIFGSTFDHNLEGKMRVSVVATGIEAGDEVARAQPAKPLPVKPAAGYALGRLAAPAKEQPKAAQPAKTVPLSPVAGYCPLGRLAAPVSKQPEAAQPARKVEFTKAERTREKPREDREAGVRYVVWERELMTGIYKAPRIQLARMRNEPHAEKLKVFDSIEDARTAADAIFSRIIRQRKARRLPYSFIERTKADLICRSSEEVPSYFI
jgi:cell division protein FtsZ